MRSSDFHRFLVVHFYLWDSDPWIRVGEKRRQLFDGDPTVHYLLWDIEVLHLRLPMFVLPSIRQTKPRYLTAHS